MDEFSFENLASTLGSVCDAAGIPGASASWLTREGRLDSHFGDLSISTGNRVSPSTVFQIGSITKVYTSYLALQLVERSLWSLDDSLITFLPELAERLPFSGDITIRSLLCHSSGIDGDVWIDTGRGDDCLEKYMAQFPTGTLLHAPEAMYSYCNAGFILLGLAMSRIQGRTWDEMIQSEIAERHGLARTTTLPEQAILHGAAVGHLDDNGGLAASAIWQVPRSCGPAGTIAVSTSDLVEFAKVLMSADSEFELMTEPLVPIPGSGVSSSYGLGWRIWDSGTRVVGHDGKGRGQESYLRMLPEQGEILAFSTNRNDTDEAAHEFFSTILGSDTGATVAGLQAPNETNVPDHSLIGRYTRSGGSIKIEKQNSGIEATKTTTGPFWTGGTSPPMQFQIRSAQDSPTELFAVGNGSTLDVRKYESNGDVMLFFGDRLYRRQ